MKSIYEIVKLKKEIMIHEDLKITTVETCSQVLPWLQEMIGQDSQENLVLLCLDTKRNLNSFSVVSRGTVNSTVVHPRDIFQRAILSNSTQILVAHNHPSNNPEPSRSDNKLTKKLEQAGELLGIQLLDHIIVGQDTYYSYREEGWLID